MIDTFNINTSQVKMLSVSATLLRYPQQTGVFFCEFCDIYQSNLFAEHLRETMCFNQLKSLIVCSATMGNFLLKQLFGSISQKYLLDILEQSGEGHLRPCQTSVIEIFI